MLLCCSSYRRVSRSSTESRGSTPPNESNAEEELDEEVSVKSWFANLTTELSAEELEELEELEDETGVAVGAVDGANGA
jgi:hypothetical protein